MTTTIEHGSDTSSRLPIQEEGDPAPDAPVRGGATRHDGERGLVLRAQDGDLEAFEQLMGLHVRKVRTFLALRAPAPHLIDELTHETFVFAYHHLADFTAGTSLAAWLRAIAHNLLRAEVQRFSREQRNRAKLGEHLLVEFNHQRPSSLHDGRVVDALERCLVKLPQDMQELVDMKYRECLSAQDIADRTERSVAWVRTTLFRVRQRLRDCIEQRIAGEEA